jgi:hypothetical protein
MEINEKMLRDLKKRFETEANRREIEILDRWRRELEVIYKKKYEHLGSIQIDIKNLMERMTNRISMVTRIIKDEG